MSERESRVLVVTGGGSGIGRGTALYFAARGYRVAIIGRDREKLRSTAERIGPGCRAFQADVSKLEQVQSAVRDILEAFGRVDVLMNNAGSTSTILSTTPMEEAVRVFRGTIETHLFGAFYMTMALVPHLTRPGGRIINISSIGAVKGGGRLGSGAYIAAKDGLHGLAHSFARELSPQGITVNVIAPGYIETALTERWSEERRRKELGDILVGRPGKPEDIAAAAYYLASPEASFVTGEILNVNGGAFFAH